MVHAQEQDLLSGKVFRWLKLCKGWYVGDLTESFEDNFEKEKQNYPANLKEKIVTVSTGKDVLKRVVYMVSSVFLYE